MGGNKKGIKKSEIFWWELKYCLNLHRKRGNSSVGRASASQAEGHEFEPRLPLQTLKD